MIKILFVCHGSNCDFETSSIRRQLFLGGSTNYCPRCGSNMKNIKKAGYIAGIRDDLEESIRDGSLDRYEWSLKVALFTLQRPKSKAASG